MKLRIIALSAVVVCSAMALSFTYFERAVPEIYIEGNRAIVSMAGCEGGLPGEPDLPVRTINLALPSGTRATSISYTAHEEPLASGVSVSTICESEYYAPWPFPAVKAVCPAELVSTGVLFGVPVAQIRLSPVNYYSSEGALTRISSFDLEIALEPWGYEAPKPEASTPFSAGLRRRVLERAVVNPEAVDVGFTSIPMDEMRPRVRSFPPASGDDPADGVVIVPERYLPYFEEFIFDEIAFGLSLEAIPLEALYSAYPHGVDRAERIRRFIVEAYAKWGISGAFLVGDIDELPVRFRFGAMAIPTYSEVPTDLYFASLDGDWNENGNRYFGEQDGDDYFPEIFVGRFQPEDTIEVLGYIEKLRAHRRGLEPDFARRWLFACASLSPTAGDRLGQVLCDSLIETYVPSGIDALRMFSFASTSGGDMELNSSNFMNELALGRYLICHFDHGYQYILHTGKYSGGGGLSIQDFMDMSNAPNFPILHTYSCEVNAIDLASVGAAAVRAPNGGLVAVLAHSRSAWTSQSSLVFLVWANNLLPFASIKLGEVLQNSILAMSDNIVYRYYKTITTLFGYPFLDVFPQGLTEIDLTLFSDTISSESSVILPSVTNSSTSAPMAGVTIVARTPAGRYAMGVTDDSGTTRLLVRAGEAECVYVSAFGGGAAFAEETVYVASSERAFVVVEEAVFRETAGDGDASFEPGDTFVCDIRIKNCGVLTADTVSIKLRNCDAIDSVGTSVSLAGGDTVTLPSIFTITASPRTRGITNLRPIVHFEIDGRESADTLAINIDGPILRHFYTDYSGGSGSMPSEGDTAFLMIGVTNTGFGDFRGGRVSLSVAGATLGTPSFDIDTISPFDTLIIPVAVIANGPLLKGIAVFEFSNTTPETVLFERSVPSAPESLMVEPSVTSIRLYWSPPEDSSVFGYNVYRRGIDPGSEWHLLNVFPISFATFIDEGLPPTTRYYYRVTAIDNWLNESRPSDSVPAWTTLSALDGWPRSVGFSIKLYSSIVLFDTDGDGAQEVFVGGQNYSAVFALFADGEDVYDSTMNTDPFAVFAWVDSIPSPNGVWGSPALGDVTGDGDFEMLANQRDNSMKLYLLDLNDGSNEAGWPVSVKMSSMGTPVLADLDNDGSLEIVNPTFDGLEVYRADGSSFIPDSGGVFYKCEEGRSGSLFGSPAIGDIDGDGEVEFAFGGPADSLGQGTFWVLEADGSVAPGWPVRIPWANFSGCNPVIANFDSDTSTLEILAPSNLSGIYIFTFDGGVLPGWPVEGFYFWEFGSNCAAADFDGDGVCEAVISGSYDVAIYSANGSPLPGWPITLGSSTEFAGNATIGDIDGDGFWDLVYALNDRIHAFDISGTPIPGFPLVTKDNIFGAPTLGDIDGDGEIEIAIGCFDSRVYIWKTGAPNTETAIAWPTHKGNFSRTGLYGDHWKQLPVSERAIPRSPEILARPNPFNSAIRITIDETELNEAPRAEIFDISGRRIVCLEPSVGLDKTSKAGLWEFIWHPENDASSGVYLVRMNLGGSESAVKRIVYLK